MILRIQKAELQDTHQLWLSFNDGASGVVDPRPLMTGPVFEPLMNPQYFSQFILDPICGTVVWPNGMDFAPEALHALVEKRIHGGMIPQALS